MMDGTVQLQSKPYPPNKFDLYEMTGTPGNGVKTGSRTNVNQD